MSMFFRRRTTSVAAVAGLSTGLLGASTAFAADGATLVFDPSLAFIMPAAIILAFIAEMVVLILRRSDDYA
jgi:hypothetical protein